MNFTENDVQLFCIKGHDYFDLVRWVIAEYPDIGTVFYDVSVGRDNGMGVRKENIRKISDKPRNLFVFSDLALNVVKEQVALTNNLVLFVRDCFNTFASRLLINRKSISCPINDYVINLWKQYAFEYHTRNTLGENCLVVNANIALPFEPLYEDLLNDPEFTSIFDEEMVVLSEPICREMPSLELGQVYQPRVTEKALATIGTLINRQMYDEALKIANVLADVDDSFELKRQFASIYSKKGEKNKAIKLLEKELTEDNKALIYNLIASVYSDNRDYEEAIKYSKMSLEIKDAHDTRTNLGHYCMHNYEIDNSIIHFEKALEEVNTPGYRTNLANAYVANHQYEKAMQTYEEALDDSLSEHADIHINMGFLKYYLGQEQEGWKECEYRLKTHLADYMRIYNPNKYWKGQDLNGKKILIFGEQGLGDTIQFARYSKHLKENYDCHTILMCSEKLHELMSQSPYIDELASKEEFIYNNEYDYHIPTMSFPYALNNLISDNNYLSISDKMDLGEQLNIGICWKGSAGYASDMHRSCNPNLFKILNRPNVKLFSLQKDEEVEFAEKMYLNNFKDTAIAINSLDLIVTVDTSVMHLAATLNKPTFGMLSIYHDWRWQQSEKTKWYPSLRFFKQTKGGDWNSVLKQIDLHVQNLCK